MLRCPACGNLIFPRINPVVITAVTDGDDLLLSTYAGRGYTNYALIAGYAEIGETIEDCVCREVMEETGLTVHNLRYYKSQPWSFSGSLLFGFFCDTDEKTIRLDRDELKSAVWKKPEDSFDVPGTASLTSEMIHVFREGGVKYGH